MQPDAPLPPTQPTMDVRSPSPQPPEQSTPKSADGMPVDMMLPPHKKERHMPVAAILIALTIALGLMALTAFVFIQSKKQTQITDDAPTSQTQPSNRVGGEDIEKVKTEIDRNLNNINDSTAFSSDDLSNKTLGL
jgi:uncharacterized membrane protein YebE (DUF533 family)